MSQAKVRVLFVDDDENVLHGLKRLLRAQRESWDMDFVTNGAGALSLMDQKPIDVVVSDMKMPSMDGAQLLSEVRRRHPAAVRMILSGFAEKEAILRTIGPSHRYLAKPCSQEDLVGAVHQAMALHAYIDSPQVKSAVSRLTHLPTLPETYAEIIQELESEYASADSLAEKVSADVAISAQLMKLTNSAYFNLPVKATTVKQAIQALGFDNVRSVVLFAGVFDQFRAIRPSLADTVEALGHHSLEMGLLTKRLMVDEKHSGPATDQAFCAGLLAHVGTLLMIANDPDAFTLAMKKIETDALSVCEAERLVFGASHAQLGGYLLGLWGFSDTIVEAVAFHHEPRLLGKSESDTLTVLHAVQYLLRDKNGSAARKKVPGALDGEYLKTTKYADRLPMWRTRIDCITKEWRNE